MRPRSRQLAQRPKHVAPIAVLADDDPTLATFDLLTTISTADRTRARIVAAATEVAAVMRFLSLPSHSISIQGAKFPHAGQGGSVDERISNRSDDAEN
jgi:hypothetical protein